MADSHGSSAPSSSWLTASDDTSSSLKQQLTKLAQQLVLSQLKVADQLEDALQREQGLQEGGLAAHSIEALLQAQCWLVVSATPVFCFQCLHVP